MRKSIDLFAFHLIGKFSAAVSKLPARLGNLLCSEQQVSQAEKERKHLKRGLKFDCVGRARRAFESEKRIKTRLPAQENGLAINRSV